MQPIVAHHPVKGRTAGGKTIGVGNDERLRVAESKGNRISGSGIGMIGDLLYLFPSRAARAEDVSKSNAFRADPQVSNFSAPCECTQSKHRENKQGTEEVAAQ